MFRFIPIIFLFPFAAFAYVCPNNNSLLDDELTAAQVIARCGNPISIKNFVRNDSGAEEWVYYIDVKSKPLKMTINFNNKTVSKINISTGDQDCENYLAKDEAALDSGDVEFACAPSDRNVGGTDICGEYIEVTSDAAAVQKACGSPATHRVLQMTATAITELSYPSRDGKKILYFENDVLKKSS